ncbi:MAG: hypothetical protein FJZ47_07035 [Candidatus Tectomicrobia bacterium]|uniref:Tetratricopeptide repeat protein n=1 Tax=Tectimicrobiota bacterium TaxID=2528274 RepID=A0A937VZP2_UNCTE|nr:hypothetical protein [Candidatus Tectomicrobia bacterium]
MHRMTLLEQERQQLTARLAAAPQSPQLYIQRGMIAFKLGAIAEAIADFDAAERLDEGLTPYLWQRGLAYYYAERFAEGARQFEIDLRVNGHDVEETVWRYLCQARLSGTAIARASLLPVRSDARPVMAWIYQLFAGECAVSAVLQRAQEAGRRERFYSHLYVGLYYEAAGEATQAREHITQAAAMQVLDDYMGWLAMVHQRVRGWDND